jgi:hypothetical protein
MRASSTAAGRVGLWERRRFNLGAEAVELFLCCRHVAPRAAEMSNFRALSEQDTDRKCSTNLPAWGTPRRAVFRSRVVDDVRRSPRHGG